MKVKFKSHLEDHEHNMTIGEIYEVIGIEADNYRIVCNKSEPYLYEPTQFEIIDDTKPSFWVSEYGEDGELYAYPFAWFNNYFFEDYFDNVNGKVEAFWKDCKRLYGINKNV